MEVPKKPIYRGDCLKKGAWTVCRFQGGLARKRGVFVRGRVVDTPVYTDCSKQVVRIEEKERKFSKIDIDDIAIKELEPI